MRVINKTSWSTKDLKRVFKLVCKEETFTPKIVEVVYSGKEGYYSGLGQYDYGWIRLRVPNSKKVAGSNGKVSYEPLKELNTNVIAYIFAHEIQHNIGLHHREMNSKRFWNQEEEQKLIIPYVKGLTIKRKEVKPKTKKDIKQLRYEHAIIMLRKYELKIKRIGNLIKKWQRKVNYYKKLKGE